MRRLLLGSLVLLVSFPSMRAAGQGIQSGPPINPQLRPPISPYLNLLRGGNPAVNYYGLVRPQQDVQSSLQHLQQQATGAYSYTTTGEAVTITGHPTRFMNYSHYYYYNLAGGGSATTRPAGSIVYPSAGSSLGYPGLPPSVLLRPGLR